MSILTPAELRSLALTLVFVVVGAGARLWQRSQVRLGPYLEGTHGAAASVPPPSDTAVSADLAGLLPSSAADPPAATTSFPEDRSLLVHASLGAPGFIEPSGSRPTGAPRRASRRDKKASGGPRKTCATKVALNQAGVAELAQVPGIGEKTAQAILAYRKTRGPFMDLRELLHVKGIGEKKLERITSCLVLSPVREEEPARQAGLPP